MNTALMQDNILVIKLSALGDFIQALGAMAAIRRHHPDAQITLLTTKPFIEFGEKCGYFNSVICDARPKFWDIAGFLSLRNCLRAGNYTRVYDLQNNDRSCFYFRLFSAFDKPQWVGTARGASHRNISPLRIAGNSLDGHRQTLKLAGIENITLDTLDWINEENENTGQFNIPQPFALLVPGCAPQHPHKRWPATYYGALAQKLRERGIHSVILGTQAESDAAQCIQSIAPETINLIGRTNLFHIGCLAKKARLAVGNDTGPMHMIAPTGCPSLVLFSKSSDPARHAPMGARVQILQQENLSDLPPDIVWARMSGFF